MKTLFLWPAFGAKHSRYPPLGIAYLAAVLIENNFPIEIIDASKYVDYGEFERELIKKRPDILGISVLSVHYDSAIKAAKIAKRVLPSVTVVFGGPHPTVLPEETLKNSEIDVVITGEGEFKYLDFLKAISGKTDLSQVKGIYYKADAKIIKTPDAEPIENLDTIPLPARHLLPMHEYIRQAPTLPLPFPSTTIIASRGCYGNCRFCQPTLKKIFGGKVRYRNPARVVEEMIALKNEYHLKGIYFADDEPTWEREWMLELCEEIVRRKVEIAWICASRVDTVDLELLRTMKKAGCIQIGFGVESGSQKILNYYRKGLKKERIAPAFRMCQEVGIIARANIMIGAPHETTADVQETISLLRKIKPDLIAVSVTTPIPGTDLFTDANEKGILRKGVLGVYDRFYIDTMKRALSDSEIKKLIRKIVRAYLYEIAVLLLNPFELYKRRHLFYRILVHWGTLRSDLNFFSN